MDLTRDEHGKPLFDAAKRRGFEDAFYQLVCLMTHLRRGCPWDREQTPQSLRRYVLEEAYEVLETIEDENWPGLREELGDFVLQAVFQAKIQEEAGRFDIEDVLRDLVAKMVRRHPHVFAEVDADTPSAVEQSWEKIKQEEKGSKGALSGLTRGMPALLESYKIAKKAAKVGFDWPEASMVLDKIEEEIGEIKEVGLKGDQDALAEELGDLMFAVANLVRKCGLEPEETLRRANRKFVGRFQAMEALAEKDGQAPADLSLDEMEALWQEVKRQAAARQT